MSKGVNILLPSVDENPDKEVGYTRPLPAILAAHQQIHNGKGFTHNDRHLNLANAGVSDHLIKVGDNALHVTYFGVVATGSPVVVEYYENTTVSADGTPMALGNNNRTSEKVTTATMFEGPTITGVGDRLGGTEIPDITVGAGQSSGGQAILGGGEWILKPNTNYLYRITNNSGSAINYNITLFYYEPGLS